MLSLLLINFCNTLKVICVDNTKYPSLEIGKCYEGKFVFGEIGDLNTLFFIENKIEWKDNFLYLEGYPSSSWFSCKCFKTLEEFRSFKLEELGL